MKKKIIKLCTSLLISSCLFVGCSEYNDNYSGDTPSENKTYSGEDIYTKKLSNTLEVDAKVESIDLSKVEMLKVDRKIFDLNIATEIFFGNEEREISKRKEEYDNETIDITTVKSKDGSELEISNGDINYKNPDRDYVDMIRTLSDNEVWENKNLEFMDKDTAIKKAIEVCNKLGIKISNEPIGITCIDIDNMKNEEKRIKEGPSYDDFIQKINIKNKEISKDKEAYIIDFSIEEGGIKYNEDLISLQTVDELIEGSFVSVTIDKNGVSGFKTEGVIYEKTATKDTNSKIITIDEALDKVNDIYKDILTNDVIKISKIGLRYITSIDNRTYQKAELIPVWCFTVDAYQSKKGIEGKELFSYKIYINAITGDEVI
ncbi:MAG: hypothetical protein ACRCXA_02195 [Peptostreptococcaceae bacterium]